MIEQEEKYKKETGFDVGKIHEIGTTYYSDDYVKWLEKAIDYIPCCTSKAEQLSVAWKALEWVGFTRGEEFNDDDIQEMLNA